MTETLTSPVTELLEQLIDEKDLIVYNDDVNTFEHVIESLIKVCGHENMQAEHNVLGSSITKVVVVLKEGIMNRLNQCVLHC
jgi:hypothetical protein